MNRSKIIWIVVAVLVLTGIVVFSVKAKSRDTGTQVTTANVEKKDLVSKVTASGKIEAKRKVQLSANIMGQIINLAVREGDSVKKGDFLLQIDRVQHEASAVGAEAGVRAVQNDHQAALAAAAEADANYSRAKKSFADHIISAQELDRARAAADGARANVEATQGRIEQARASLAGARDTLSKTTIRAPIDGLVTALPVEEGEVAVIGTMNNAGTQLMTISDMSVVDAIIDVDETDVPAVKIGQKVTLTIDAYPNKTFSGVVREVGSSPRTSTGAVATAGSTEAVNFEVKVQLENPPAAVRPGMSVSADIVTATKEKSTAIPIQALVTNEKPGATGPAAQQEGVYLFNKDSMTVKFVPVHTGITGDTMVEVVDGVKPGDTIVNGPFKALRELKDGAKVKLMKNDGKDDKGAAEAK